MKFLYTRKVVAVIAVIRIMTMSACSTERVIDNTVGVAAGKTKLAARGVVGVGKLAVRGTGAAINAVSGDE